MATASECLDAQENRTEHDDRKLHQIRITSHGKIRAWVTFALGFFQTNPDKPLVFHTLPASHSSTTTVPRLISVAEIIKREYLKQLAGKHSNSTTGLHQYNEIHLLEHANVNHDAGEQTADRTAELRTALDGKNHPKQKQIAVMVITLCREPLRHLEEMGATYQRPSIHRMSRSAKARLRKRQAKA